MKNKNPHVGHRDRLRNLALTAGIDSMHEHQVLELYLFSVVPYKDTNPMAHELLDKFGSFANVFEADVEALKTVGGIGDSIAKNITLLVDIFRYYLRSRDKRDIKLNNTNSAYQYFREIFQRVDVEEVYVVALDNENRVIKRECISRGNFASAGVDVKKINEFLLRHRSNKFLIGHNHPGGRAHPSASDDAVTKAITMNSIISSFEFLDHIVVGQDEVYSYKSANKIEKFKFECMKFINEQGTLLKSEVQGKYSQEVSDDESIC